MFDELFEKSETEVNLVPIARQIMKKAFEDDPDFKRAYADNIAMRLYDRQIWNHEEKLDFTDKLTRDSIANEILDLIFG
jgi:hypothetical protein